MININCVCILRYHSMKIYKLRNSDTAAWFFPTVLTKKVHFINIELTEKKDPNEQQMNFIFKNQFIMAK